MDADPVKHAQPGDAAPAAGHADPSTLDRARAVLRRHLSVARYVLVGGFNTLLDVGLFTVLVTVFDVRPLVANIVSTVVTMCVSYLLNRTFVFRSDRSHARAFLPFVIVTLTSGLVIQSLVITGVIAAGEALTTLPHDLLAPVAKICAVAVGMVGNYLGYRYIFRGRNR